MGKKLKRIKHELIEHSPFTLFATVIAILIVVVIKSALNKEIPEAFFEILHPAHLLVSSIVTAAIYYKYKKSIFKSMIIGILGSIIIGSLSDVFFPWLGGITLGLKMEFHLPVIKEPFLIISTAIIGSILGIATKITKIPHFIHVFISVFASLFYIVSFSNGLLPIQFLLSTIIVFIAVLIPCCISDIVFPIIFSKENNTKSKKTHHH